MKAQATSSSHPMLSILGAAVVSGAIVTGFFLGFLVYYVARAYVEDQAEVGTPPIERSLLPQETPGERAGDIQ